MTNMTFSDIVNTAIDNHFIEEEARRIDPQPIQGNLPNMVQTDMGNWAKATGVWGSSHYKHVVDAHAEARGWTQGDFTGFETFGEDLLVL